MNKIGSTYVTLHCAVAPLQLPLDPPPRSCCVLKLSGKREASPRLAPTSWGLPLAFWDIFRESPTRRSAKLTTLTRPKKCANDEMMKASACALRQFYSENISHFL